MCFDFLHNFCQKKKFSFYEELSVIWSDVSGGFRVKYPLQLSDFNGTWIFSTYFRKMLKYKISWKSVQWEQSCSVRTDGQTDRTTVIVAFRNFAKAPKNSPYFRWHEFSLPCSQEPATCFHPEPDYSCPRPPSYLFKIHFNRLFPSTTMSSTCSLSLRLPHQSPVYTSPLLLTCYMLRLSNSSWFDHPDNIRWAERIMELLTVQFPPLPSYLVPLRPTYLPQHPTQAPQPKFLLYNFG